MDPALRRRDRDTERFGDLGVRQRLDVTEHDRGPVLERQRRELTSEQVAQPGLGIGRGGQTVVELQDVRPLPPPAHQGLVDGNPVEPSEELRIAAEPAQVAPGLDEDILGCLLDVASIIEQPVQDRCHPMLVCANELGEGAEVARGRTLDQLLIAIRSRHADDGTVGIAVAGRGIQPNMSVIERLLVGGCAGTRERLSDIADGEARGLRGWRARAHLARCELCQAVYDSLVRTIERLRTLREADRRPPFGSVADAVVARVRHEPPPQ
jgi:hypothetical protein